MLSAREQLERLERELLQTGGTLLYEPVAQIEERDLEGFLQLGLEYSAGQQLHVAVALDVTHGYPLWTEYAFHFQDGSAACVFRYDNSRHYRDMATFPHHKHVGAGEEAHEHPLPTLSSIIDEVLRHIVNGSTAGEPGSRG